METMDAKVKPRRRQPLFAWRWDRARARAHPVLKGTGTLVVKNVCAIVWPTGQWVHASSLTPLGPELHLLAPRRSGATPVAVQAGGRLVTPAGE